MNAPENATAEFQAGYKAASEAVDHEGMIYEEFVRRGKPKFEDQNFKEWKRGMWAFRLQQAEAKGMTAP